MRPPPPHWPRISSAVYYEDGGAAIDWLCRAFGFEVRLRIEGEDGRIEHSELEYGEGLIMVGEPRDTVASSRSPRQAGGANTQNLFMYVDDVEAHCRRARDAGAVIVSEPTTHDYGEDYWADRTYGCVDIGGHHWWFAERLRSPAARA